MNTELHWQIALNQFCPIPPAGKRKYDNTSKWMTDREPNVFADQECVDEMIEVIDTLLKAGVYSVVKYLHRFDIKYHTKISYITKRRKKLDLARSLKQDEVIKMHLSGMRNFEISNELRCKKEYVSQTIRRYKERENVTTS